MSSEVKGHFRRDGTYVSPHTRRNNNPGRATEKARDVKGQLGDFSPTSYQEPEPLTGTPAYHPRHLRCASTLCHSGKQKQQRTRLYRR